MCGIYFLGPQNFRPPPRLSARVCLECCESLPLPWEHSEQRPVWLSLQDSVSEAVFWTKGVCVGHSLLLARVREPEARKPR